MRLLRALPMLLLVACSGSGDDGTDDGTIVPPVGGLTYKPCGVDKITGGFDITLAATFTSAQGQIANGVVPNQIPMVVDTIGECQLFRPRTLFCDPACPASMTCGQGGVCVDRPVNIGVGTVTMTGLEAAVEMTATEPVFFYNFRGTLPHPGVAPGADIALAADNLTLQGFGIEPLTTTATIAKLERGQPLSLQWNAPAEAGPSKVLIDLNIANHGGNPGNVACHVDDDGAFEIPSTFVDALLDLGFSGFPEVNLTRRSVDSAELSTGCVELRVNANVLLDVEIAGLTSCSGPDDCENGQTCRADLTCG